MDVVRYLVQEAKPDPNKGDRHGWTPTYIAAKEGHLGVVQYLVEVVKVDYNKADKHGWTPLHIAAVYQQPAVANYLRSIGAKE